jgi:hypothetical protein
VVETVSCASAGNCGAGGYYEDSVGHGQDQAFVVTETNGTWGTAEEVPGTAALNTGGSAVVNSVSCASAGTCTAGGVYTDSAMNAQVFVVGETNGVWGTAEEVPGTAALNQGGAAYMYAVSCGSAGDCSAGGDYYDHAHHEQAFVADETNGIWHRAEEVPGTAALNKDGSAAVVSLSCASAGTCSAGGQYLNGAFQFEAFVVNETNGRWGTAQTVAAALNKGGNALIDSVSCASAGNCSAGGDYTSIFKHGRWFFQAFVASETDGTWAAAEEVPGSGTLNAGANALVESVSCASAGNCSAGGYYGVSLSHQQAFVASEKNGSWGTAEEVPGSAILNKGVYDQVSSVSCATAGNCSAGGFYTDSHGAFQAFVVTQTNGTWGHAEEVPGTAALNKGGWAQANSVSCAAAAHCSAGGQYENASGFEQAFVVGET